MHRLKFIFVMSICFCTVGCLEGPFKLGRYNPIYQEEWKKDKQYGPTLHDKFDELATLRNKASSLSPPDQQRHSAELLQLMQNERNALLVAEIARTLGAFPTPEAAEGLRIASAHGDSDVRVAACDGWARKGGQEGLEVLANVLGSDTDIDVRLSAARGLQNFRDPTAVQALGLALEAHDPALQFRAVNSLKKVTGKDFGDSVPAWREFVKSGQAKPSAAPSLAEQFRSWF